MEPVLDTLQEAIVYFSNPTNCREYLVARRWPNGVECPRCGSKNVTFLEKYNRWQCGARHDARQFTAKTGTIFEDSPLGLDKWLMAMWQVVNCKNGVSSYEVHRAIGVTQKTAWFMDHRIRHALTMGTINKLSGQIEADETFIGGKARNMHSSARATARSPGPAGRRIRLLSWASLSAAVRSLPRWFQIARKRRFSREIRQHVLGWFSAIFTDALKSYKKVSMSSSIRWLTTRLSMSVAKCIPTGCENFWALLKRTLGGTYVSVEPFHLFRYLDEQAFRYNNRKFMNDGQRFDLAVRQIVGKRLTWDQLTGKIDSASQAF